LTRARSLRTIGKACARLASHLREPTGATTEGTPMASGTKMYQIYDDDLATLERTLPQLADAVMPVLNNRLRVQLRQVQKILSEVRWNYGPPAEVQVIGPDEEVTP